MGRRLAWLMLSIIMGALTIALGIFFLARPGLALATTLLWFGIVTIAYGVALVIAGLVGRAESRAWAVVEGLFGVIAGVVVLVWPGLTALMLLYIIAAWMIVSGIGDVAGAFMRGIGAGQRLWLFITGLVGLGVGALFFARPLGGALALLWLIGVYLVALGFLRILHGFTLPPGERRAAV